MEENLAFRRQIWDSYDKALTPLEEAGVLRILRSPSYCQSNAHMFAIQLPTPEDADRTRIQLNEDGDTSSNPLCSITHLEWGRD